MRLLVVDSKDTATYSYGKRFYSKVKAELNYENTHI